MESIAIFKNRLNNRPKFRPTVDLVLEKNDLDVVRIRHEAHCVLYLAIQMKEQRYSLLEVSRFPLLVLWNCWSC